MNLQPVVQPQKNEPGEWWGSSEKAEADPEAEQSRNATGTQEEPRQAQTVGAS